MGGSLTLYALKAPNVKSESSFSWLSREVLLLVNNVFLTVMAITVLLGTLYPLLIDGLTTASMTHFLPDPRTTIRPSPIHNKPTSYLE
jgi:cytochrome c biogenesis factor